MVILEGCMKELNKPQDLKLRYLKGRKTNFDLVSRSGFAQNWMRINSAQDHTIVSYKYERD